VGVADVAARVTRRAPTCSDVPVADVEATVVGRLEDNGPPAASGMTEPRVAPDTRGRPGGNAVTWENAGCDGDQGAMPQGSPDAFAHDSDRVPPRSIHQHELRLCRRYC
jgi:hypothetical protein